MLYMRAKPSNKVSIRNNNIINILTDLSKVKVWVTLDKVNLLWCQRFQLIQTVMREKSQEVFVLAKNITYTIFALWVLTLTMGSFSCHKRNDMANAFFFIFLVYLHYLTITRKVYYYRLKIIISKQAKLCSQLLASL